MDISEHQALHNAIIENSGYAIVACTETGEITLFNRAAEALLGYSSDEIAGKSPVIFHLQEEIQQRAVQFSHELGLPVAPGIEVFLVKSRLGLPNKHQWTLVTKQGTQVPVLLSVSALKDRQGLISGFVGIVADITKRKKIEQNLKLSQSRFEKLFNVSPDPVWIIQDNRFIDCNQAAIELLGYPNKAKLINTHPSELSPEKQPDGELSFAKAERLIVLTRETHIQRFEWVHTRFDNSHFWAEVTLTSFEQDGIPLIHCIWRDITEKKKVQEALRASEQRLQDIVGNVSDWVWEMDLDGNFVYADGDTLSILGYTNDEILQMNAFDLMPDEDAGKVARVFDEIVKHQQPFRNLVNINLHRDGTRKYILSSGVPVFDHENKLIGYRGADSDNTQNILLREKLQKANLELEEKVEMRTRELHDAVIRADRANDEKSRFLANMSHELRTPMHAILSFSNLGLKRVEDDKLERYLQNIRTSGIRLTKLIDDLLDLSKLEAGKLEADFIEQDVVTLVANATEEVSSLIEEKAISIRMNYDSSINCELDQKLMSQVIINLLSNAIKFSPAESTIEIKLQLLDYPYNQRPKQVLRISVLDDGMGIPAEDQATIFDKFAQSRKTTTDRKGTGLGLAIAREIVELHHGKIALQSPPAGRQSGTVFIIEMPVQQPLDSVDSGKTVQQAIDSYLDWQNRIDRLFVDRQVPDDFDTALIENEHLCGLGEWLGLQKQDTPELKKLKDLHRVFHASVSECLSYLRTEDYSNAQLAKQDVDEKAGQLIGLLNSLVQS